MGRCFNGRYWFLWSDPGSKVRHYSDWLDVSVDYVCSKHFNNSWVPDWLAFQHLYGTGIVHHTDAGEVRTHFIDVKPSTPAPNKGRGLP